MIKIHPALNVLSVMKTILVGLTKLLVVGIFTSAIQADVVFKDSNFTMGDPTGNPIGNSNDVEGMWDGTYNTHIADTKFNMSLRSDTPFFGIPWFAHHVRVFGPGTWTFESGCTTEQLEAGISACGGRTMTMTVDQGQIGAHMLFDWSVNKNIDVVNVYDLNAVFDGGGLSARLYTRDVCGFYRSNSPFCQADPENCATQRQCTEELKNTLWMGASTDDDNNGAPSVGMVDGPFRGFNANFNLRALLIASVKAGPQTLNVNSKGNGFSVEISEIPGIDGSALDLSRVEDGVAISSVGDVEIPMGDIVESPGNRYFDGSTLTIYFDDSENGNRQDVIAAVAGLVDGTVVSICVKGKIIDNLDIPQNFEGCNDITIIDKGK